MIARRRFRAPTQDRSLLAVPELSEVAGMLARNQRIVHEAKLRINGMSLPAIRAEAIAEIHQQSQKYLDPTIGTSAPRSLIVTGHQPELAHPGVWIKNFAAAELADRHGTHALNLIIDTDIPKSAGITLPTWDHLPDGRPDPASVQLNAIPFGDKPSSPFSTWDVADCADWSRFPARVRSATASWGYTPLFDEFFQATDWSEMTGNVGERFSQARRTVERGWGISNAEVPISWVAHTTAFARFAWYLIEHLPAFIHAYNLAVRTYRRSHKIRSRRHPVPELAIEGERLETPFWAWSTSDGTRQRLWITRSSQQFVADFGSDGRFVLPTDPDGFVACWRALSSEGIQIAGRALATTLFARLFLADLFIHGIGGGKYDEVTDAIIESFFQMKPPGFLVLSATLHLPLKACPTSEGELQKLIRLERDYHWNPQRYAGPECEHLTNQKQTLIEHEPQDRRSRRQWCRELRTVTEKLRQAVARECSQVKRQREEVELAVKANVILKRRDYASVLYPGNQLREAFQQLLNG